MQNACGNGKQRQACHSEAWEDETTWIQFTAVKFVQSTRLEYTHMSHEEAKYYEEIRVILQCQLSFNKFDSKIYKSVGQLTLRCLLLLQMEEKLVYQWLKNSRELYLNSSNKLQ
jgi:hypothetical protein